jgi:hypothetical protein
MAGNEEAVSKPKPGQVVLDAIQYRIDWLEQCPDEDFIKGEIATLKSWRAAFKKMAGAVVWPGVYGIGRPGFSLRGEIDIAKAALKARAVEARRKT